MHPGCRRFWIVRTSCSCRICNCCQRGKLVRNDPHLPTRAVGRCPGISYCQRFRDRNAFIAFRKRIVRAAGHAFAAAEIEWAFCSRWSIENGPAVNRIAADGKFLGRVVGEHGRSGTAAESGQHRARRWRGLVSAGFEETARRTTFGDDVYPHLLRTFGAPGDKGVAGGVQVGVNVDTATLHVNADRFLPTAGLLGGRLHGISVSGVSVGTVRDDEVDEMRPLIEKIREAGNGNSQLTRRAE